MNATEAAKLRQRLLSEKLNDSLAVIISSINRYMLDAADRKNYNSNGTVGKGLKKEALLLAQTLARQSTLSVSHLFLLGDDEETNSEIDECNEGSKDADPSWKGC
jgi:hypothetical protein